MSRVKRGMTAHARHKKILDMAKGYRGRNKNVFRVAVEKVEKGLQYAYRDRRAKKRSFRALWIQRINAATRLHDMTYSRFISGLNKAGSPVRSSTPRRIYSSSMISHRHSTPYARVSSLY